MGIKKALHKISNSITKTILVMIVFFAVITLFMTVANKDKIKIDPEETTRQQRADIYTLINDPAYQKNDAGKAAIGVYRTMMCGTIGEACTDNPDDADENFNHSLFGFVSNLIVMPYANPPASGVQYIAYSLGNAGLIPKTYAAEGIGFASIKPMIEIWKAFRNVAYLILVLVLIAIGFMIMFRMKLNPQTVISLENSLPKIVISLILITFSFAIAGLLIDVMYVVIAGSISILSEVKVNALIPDNLQALQDKYLTAGLDDLWPFNGVGNVAEKTWQGSIVTPVVVGNALTRLMPALIRNILLPIATFFTTALVTKQVRKLWFAKDAAGAAKNLAIFGTTAGWLPALIAIFVDLGTSVYVGPIVFGLLLALLFAFTLLFLQFRIFFMLLIAYIKILILIILSPVLLLFEAIPGKNAFSFWLKSIIGELLTFPLVVILLLLGYAITNFSGGAHPPFSQNDTFFRPPFLFGIDDTAFTALVGMGFILMIPNIAKAVKEFLGIKGLPGFGFGPGAFFAGAGAVVGGGLGLLSQFGSLSLAVPALRRWAGNLPFIGEALQQDVKKAKQLTPEENAQQFGAQGD